MASRPSKFDFWMAIQSEPGQCDMASRPSEFDFRGEPSKFGRLRCVARFIGSLGDWKDVAEMLKQKAAKRKAAERNSIIFPECIQIPFSLVQELG